MYIIKLNFELIYTLYNSNVCLVVIPTETNTNIIIVSIRSIASCMCCFFYIIVVYCSSRCPW